MGAGDFWVGPRREGLGACAASGWVDSPDCVPSCVIPVFAQGLGRRFGAISGLNRQSGIRNVSGRNNARYAITLSYAFLSFLLELSYLLGGGPGTGEWVVATVVVFSWAWYCRRKRGAKFTLLRMLLRDPGPRIKLDPHLHPPDDGEQRPVPPTTAWEARQRQVTIQGDQWTGFKATGGSSPSG